MQCFFFFFVLSIFLGSIGRSRSDSLAVVLYWRSKFSVLVASNLPTVDKREMWKLKCGTTIRLHILIFIEFCEMTLARYRWNIGFPHVSFLREKANMLYVLVSLLPDTFWLSYLREADCINLNLLWTIRI